MSMERTEAPTQRRQDDARKRGQVPHSREVDSALVILACLAVFKFAGGSMWAGLESMTTDTWAHLNEDPLTIDLTAQVGTALILRSFMLLVPLFGVIVVIGVLGGMAQTGGPILARDAIKPQFKRMNPMEGLKRLIASRQAYMNLVKALVKLIVVGIMAYTTFMSHWEEITTTGMEAGISESIGVLVGVSFDLAWRISLVFLALAVADYLFQRADLMRQLRMTRQEVQDEMKQSDGDPHVKAQMARQRRALMSRVMQAVPKADVVIVNPTHYAVALKYDPMSAAAPIVLAKGRDLMAQRIREVATEHGIAVIQNPPLCRAIYKAARIGQEIPAELYEAVAEILAFVYRLRAGGAIRATA